jgi:hypothetical protein
MSAKTKARNIGLGPEHDWSSHGCGIADKQSAARAGQNGSVNRAGVRNAIRHLMRSFESPVTLKSIARRLARLPHIAAASFTRNGMLTVESVKELNETADVWDITVPDGHWFSLANGAVVHNSDAFGLLAIIYEAPYAPTPRSRYSGRRSAAGGSWESA